MIRIQLGGNADAIEMKHIWFLKSSIKHSLLLLLFLVQKLMVFLVRELLERMAS